MNVGDRIKQRRKELGITADNLADLIGVSRSTMFRYERGSIEKIPADTLEPIAKALHTTPYWLMGIDEGSPKKEKNPAEAEDDPEWLILYRTLSPEQQAMVQERIRTFEEINKKSSE